MSLSDIEKKNGMIVGVEFEKLTHWDRYNLNQNIVRMERALYPDRDPESDTGELDLWRGERRNFHRLSIRKLGIRVMLDLSTIRGGIFSDVLLLNLSPAGCCLQMSYTPDLQPDSRIPRMYISFAGEKLVLRARVVHIAPLDLRKKTDADCS